MDPFTHAMVGAAAGYGLCGRKLGRSAAAVGALGGVAPDIDHFISSETDPLLYVEFHRYFTHSFAFAFIGAAVCTLPWVLRVALRPKWQWLWICSMVGYLTHILLDACTTYGTQLFWPWSRMRVGWDFISIVDPLFTLAVFVGLLISILQNRQVWVRCVLWFAIFYLGLGAFQKSRATEVQSNLAQLRGHRIERSEVMPTLGNHIVWRSLYESNGRLYSDRIRVGWLSRGRFRNGSSLPVINKEDLLPQEKAGNTENKGFDRFAWFSDHWVARSPDDSSLLGDMRYSLSTDSFDPIWGIRFVETNADVRVEWVDRPRERKINLKELWRELIGRDDRYQDNFQTSPATSKEK